MVLKDMVRSKVVPTARLTTVFRQLADSAIVSAATEVNQGVFPSQLREVYKSYTHNHSV
jgi:ATP-dependent exoDNAse (exonuclease V) alpha subunit